MTLAHVRQDQVTGEWYEHSLASHLCGTATRAESFAEHFGNGDWTKLAGVWHDLGKFNPMFQAYIKKASGYSPDAHMEGSPGKVDHSTAGAQHVETRFGPIGRVLAYLIAGHHAGLPDWAHEIGSGGALSVRLTQKGHFDLATQGSPSEELFQSPPPASSPCVQDPRHVHLWIRMLFSCLVDADFLDTEAFMDPTGSAQRASLNENLV